MPSSPCLTVTKAPNAGANARLKLHLENSKSKKGHNFVKKVGGLVPLLVWVPLLREADCKHRASDGNSKFCILLKISRFKALDEKLRLVKNQSNTSNGSRDIQAFIVAMATIFRPV